MMDFRGKKVLVTAGTGGIGLATAIKFRSHGAAVAITGRNAETLNAVASGHGLRGHVSDASDEESVRQLRSEIEESLGGLDVLVNNAGIAGPTGLVDSLDLEDWEETLKVNLTSQFLHVKHFVKMLRCSGTPSIINISSAAGQHAFPGRAAYASSKWAVIGFTKTVAAELGEDGIRVNAVCPGPIDGPRMRAVMEAKAAMLAQPIAEINMEQNRVSSLGRMSTAEDVANMVLFTASSLAGSVTGQALSVDGHIEKLY
ncbi:SDR family NAD(P)-dependent oxidoreductase [Crystallibacter degradans]|uniref:SDR family NAD(P)-dependent oxidoreductase n=1 Tax=Crystallibacter degradans TaxID=2726743 RepID=UPI00147346DD|nr:SDR family oxidoreductase [Arthrobacter sp. SF27]NMR30535.1 SDR family oxidoreductase [Arthrobacter sp. SF27]